jgi:dTDP-4-dehydrorhamnose 3,5-epimerase
VKVEALAIPEVLLLRPAVFADDRGWFFESFNEATFARATGVRARFVQDNHSGSAKGVLRGLHYQLPPHAQGKLVRAVRGRVFDVAVDLRRSSASFGRWVGVELTEDGKEQLWMPPGFAHGFLALSEWAEVAYKTTAPWHAASERALAWDDPRVGICWPLDGTPILSAKDGDAPSLEELEPFPAA